MFIKYYERVEAQTHRFQDLVSDEARKSSMEALTKVKNYLIDLPLFFLLFFLEIMNNNVF